MGEATIPKPCSTSVAMLKLYSGSMIFRDGVDWLSFRVEVGDDLLLGGATAGCCFFRTEGEGCDSVGEDMSDGSNDERRPPQVLDFRAPARGGTSSPFLWLLEPSVSELSCRTVSSAWLDPEAFGDSGSRRWERSMVLDLCHGFLRGSLDEEEAVETGSELERRTEREEGNREARKDLLDVILNSMTVQLTTNV